MSDYKKDLLQKIQDHTAVVEVAGLGYVGLPFAVEKAKVGFIVIGVEQNPLRAEKHDVLSRSWKVAVELESQDIIELARCGSEADQAAW